MAQELNCLLWQLVADPALLTIRWHCLPNATQRHAALALHPDDRGEETPPRMLSLHGFPPSTTSGTRLCGASCSFCASSPLFSISLYVGLLVWRSFWGASLGFPSSLYLPWRQNTTDTLWMGLALSLSWLPPPPHSLLFHQNPLLFLLGTQ